MHSVFMLYVELISLVALAAVHIFRGFEPVGLFSPAYLFSNSAESSAESAPH